MNIFANAERAVESYGFRKKEATPIDMMSDSAISNEALRNIDAKEKSAQKVLKEAQSKKSLETKQRLESLSKAQLASGQIEKAVINITKEAREYALKDIIFEVFSNALLLDTDFVQENSQTLYNLIDKYVDDNSGMNLLESAISTSDSVLLKKIKKACESFSMTVTKRVLTEAANVKTSDEIDFNITDKEKEDFNYAKNDLSIDDISQLVKDKVLTVVLDEKKRQEQDSEVIEDIENDLKNEDLKDDATMKEAINNIILNKSPIEEATLFNAIIRNAYADMLTENVAIHSTDAALINDDHEESKDYNINADAADVDRTIADELENTDDNPIPDDDDTQDIDITEIDNNIILDRENAINMDYVMAEAITKYTLMETLYTLKLENYSYENIRKLTEKLVNTPISKVTENKKEVPDFIKVRAEFFNYVDDLLDNRSVENVYDNLSKMSKKYPDLDLASYVKTGIKKLKDAESKNPQFKKKYDEHIKFLEELK